MTDTAPPPLPDPSDNPDKPDKQTRPARVLKTGPLGLVESLLKEPEALAEHFRRPQLRPLLILLGLLVLNLILFGLVLGSFSGGVQWWASPVKIAAGLLVAGAICFPSLYILSCLGGLDLSPGHITGGLMGTLALIGILLVGFAPIVWVFSQSTESLGFMGGLVLLTWGVSLIFGLGFLRRLFGKEASAHFQVWAVLFTLVTLQMSTALRPIIGTSDTLFPKEKRFFLQHWGDSFWEEADQKEAAREKKAPRGASHSPGG